MALTPEEKPSQEPTRPNTSETYSFAYLEFLGRKYPKIKITTFILITAFTISMIYQFIKVQNEYAEQQRPASPSYYPASSSTRSERPVETTMNSPLELLSWRMDREYGYVKAHGEVKNISSHPLRNVEVVAVFRTKDGTFVKSSSAIVEYNPIMSGQTSPFEVMSTDNPVIAKCEITFKELAGGLIQHRDASKVALLEKFTWNSSYDDVIKVMGQPALEKDFGRLDERFSLMLLAYNQERLGFALAYEPQQTSNKAKSHYIGTIGDNPPRIIHIAAPQYQ